MGLIKPRDTSFCPFLFLPLAIKVCLTFKIKQTKAVYVSAFSWERTNQNIQPQCASIPYAVEVLPPLFDRVCPPVLFVLMALFLTQLTSFISLLGPKSHWNLKSLPSAILLDLGCKTKAKYINLRLFGFMVMELTVCQTHEPGKALTDRRAGAVLPLDTI